MSGILRAELCACCHQHWGAVGCLSSEATAASCQHQHGGAQPTNRRRRCRRWAALLGARWPGCRCWAGSLTYSSASSDRCARPDTSAPLTATKAPNFSTRLTVPCAAGARSACTAAEGADSQAAGASQVKRSIAQTDQRRQRCRLPWARAGPCLHSGALLQPGRQAVPAGTLLRALLLTQRELHPAQGGGRSAHAPHAMHSSCMPCAGSRPRSAWQSRACSPMSAGGRPAAVQDSTAIRRSHRGSLLCSHARRHQMMAQLPMQDPRVHTCQGRCAAPSPSPACRRGRPCQGSPQRSLPGWTGARAQSQSCQGPRRRPVARPPSHSPAPAGGGAVKGQRKAARACLQGWHCPGELWLTGELQVDDPG